MARTAKSWPLKPGMTRVTYILPERDKRRLQAAAKRAEVSMSEIISRALNVYHKA